MAIVFSKREWSEVQAGTIRATLVPVSAEIYPGATRRAYKEFVAHDGDGNEIGRTRAVATQRGDAGERPILLTVTAVERVGVFIEREEGYLPRPLSQRDAVRCGYRALTGLRDAWTDRHPRSPLAQLVVFEWGDTRDEVRLLTSTRVMRWGPGKGGWRTRPGVPTGPLSEREKRKAIESAGQGDYTSSHTQACDDLEVVDSATEAHLSMLARQRDALSIAQIAAQNAARTEAQRVAAAERAAERIKLNLRRELTVIADRASAIERLRNRDAEAA